MLSGNRKIYILKDLFSSVLAQFKKYHASENLKFNFLGIFESLKLRLSMEKHLLNFSYTKYHSKYFGLLWVGMDVKFENI